MFSDQTRPDNILDIASVRDQAGRIRPEFPGVDALGRIPHGRYIVLRDDGTILLEISYCEGLVHGPYLELWSTGQVACKGQYQEGKQEGRWYYFHEDGTLMEVLNFKAGKELKKEKEEKQQGA
jgi:antitoxin component YwqK of YwqJK toxin-antitoxin module